MLHAPPGRLTLGVLLPGRLDYPFQEFLAMELERGRVDALLAPAPRAPDAPDPVTLLSGLSGATEHIGLVATGSPSGWDPHRLARRHVSLDVLSSGRAGWHITGPEGTAVDETLRLWDAAHRDGMPGMAPPVQRQPVLFRTDDPTAGDTFTARYADVVLTSPHGLPSARRRYAELADGVRAAARNPEHVLIWPVLTPSRGPPPRTSRTACSTGTRSVRPTASCSPSPGRPARSSTSSTTSSPNCGAAACSRTPTTAGTCAAPSA